MELQMLSRAQLAERWGVSKSFIDKTMKHDRSRLPPGVRITNRIEKFHLRDVEQFEQERKALPTV